MNATLKFSDTSAATISFSGALDRDSITKDWFATLNKQEQQLFTQVKALTLELKHVERADTAGLAWLINIVRDAKTRNIEVIFQHVPSKLSNLADLSGAKTILQA